jgi:hypothetical protein
MIHYLTLCGAPTTAVDAIPLNSISRDEARLIFFTRTPCPQHALARSGVPAGLPKVPYLDARPPEKSHVITQLEKIGASASLQSRLAFLCRNRLEYGTKPQKTLFRPCIFSAMNVDKLPHGPQHSAQSYDNLQHDPLME